jgi:thioredoxin 1
MKTIDVTDANFQEIVLNSAKPVLVDFGADWCPPCKAMEPVIEKIAKGPDGRAIIAKLDVGSNPEFTARCGVRNLPTFLLFKGGNMVARAEGAAPKSILEQNITSLL